MTSITTNAHRKIAEHNVDRTSAGRGIAGYLTAAMPHRRNPFADRLHHDFGDFAFGDDAAFAHRGRWDAFFRERIGPAFSGRVVFEVGCADADLLARVAAKRPDVGFVGLDWKAKSTYLGAQRVNEMRLRNVALIRGRAQDLLRIFGEGELDEVWVFHPDPCDKPRELPNRLVGEPFLCEVRKALRTAPASDAKFTLKTDHPGYFQWTLALLGQPEPAGFRENPRIKLREVVGSETLPPASAAIAERFDVSAISANFWEDETAQRHSAGRAFAGELTGFESRFRAKRRPIYHVELVAKQI